MKALFTFLFCVAVTGVALGQSPGQQIRTMLTNQTASWNRGDIPGFMSGYWQNDSLLFVGQSGITYGWQKTLENYRKHYPDAATMGQLTFDIVQVKSLSSHYYFVLGKWFLKRTAGDVNGQFTLVFRKFKNGWKIVSDHSS
ncbi:MAG: DUF4440 domain-containing protein [Chitinophagaceae bacterium]